jgi:hypothetical protein
MTAAAPGAPNGGGGADRATPLHFDAILAPVDHPTPRGVGGRWAAMAIERLADARTGKNGRHALAGREAFVHNERPGLGRPHDFSGLTAPGEARVPVEPLTHLWMLVGGGGHILPAVGAVADQAMAASAG